MALLEIVDPKAPPRPIGIDLGTTHSLVACIQNERPVAIMGCEQNALVPSVVSYLSAGHDAVVGDAAKARALDHPRETIASVKRFMGRGADDPETRQLGPYVFLDPKPGEANVVRFDVHGRAVTPVEVSAAILSSLRRRAEDELGRVGGAVITVPAYFDDGQRQATKDAARLAGIEVLRLLNEPTAAALAYGLEKRSQGCFAVFDLGGGTFDITILTLEDGVFQVKSTGGDSALGGDDMDRAIAGDLFVQLGVASPESVSPSYVRQVLDAARRMKHGLTEALDVEAEIDGATGSRFVRLTRSRFEELIAPLLARAGVACRRALRDAGISNSQIDGVILVGGSTRVPAVRSAVRLLFGREPFTDLNPDEVVALGAAIQADLLAGDSIQDDVLLLDVLSLSLGIEVGGGIVDKILPRNTTLPVGAKATYTTQEDNQTGFVLHVLQGERELVQDCRSLAKFTLKGIPPMQAGMAKLEVRFNVDADGLLSVNAKELTTGLEQRVVVTPSYGLDDESIEKMLMDAYEHAESDLEARRLAEERMEGQRMLAATSNAVRVDAALLEPGEAEAIHVAINNLSAAIAGIDPGRIRSLIEALDTASKGFATRRMNRAIAGAIEGHSLDDVSRQMTSIAAGHAGYEATTTTRDGARNGNRSI